ncbi:unnamed protein product [Phaeothamnion confervicola]
MEPDSKKYLFGLRTALLGGHPPSATDTAVLLTAAFGPPVIALASQTSLCSRSWRTPSKRSTSELEEVHMRGNESSGGFQAHRRSSRIHASLGRVLLPTMVGKGWRARPSGAGRARCAAAMVAVAAVMTVAATVAAAAA